MRRINLIALFFVAAITFVSCGSEPSSTSTSNAGLVKAEGDRYHGGVFKMNEEEYIRSLYPLNVTEVTGHRVVNQIYEGLVTFDQSDLSINRALASSWEIDSTGLIYTFHIRNDVYYHDDACFADGKGRKMTVQDVKYCLDRVCAYDVNNKGYDFVKDKIKGATAYYNATKNKQFPEQGCDGVKIIDNETVQIALARPFGGFLNILALPFCYIYPHEAFDTYGVEMRVKTVGTGPFYLKSIRENDAIILLKHEKYWGQDQFGNQLPYLNGIRWSFISDKKSELLEFNQGNLDMIYRFPLEMVDEILDANFKLRPAYAKYQFQEKPSMTLQYYGFMINGDLFNDIRIRKAFNYAVDRQKIVDFTVKGAGVPGHYGIVPPAFPGYDATAVKGYKFNPKEAKSLMKQAGFENGKNFPEVTLQINSGGGRNEQIAEAIQKMLQEVLNVNVKITKMPFAQHLESIETSKTDFWRSGWIADYPDPENFLTLLYSDHIPPKLEDRSYLNTTRFKNNRYDQLFQKAVRETDPIKRNELYLKADQLATDEAPFLVLFYSKDRRLQQPDVMNYPQNAMEYRALREVYFVPENATK